MTHILQSETNVEKLAAFATVVRDSSNIDFESLEELELKAVISDIIQLNDNSYAILDPCFPNPCKNGGVCSKNKNGGFNCNCSTSGYYGPKCDQSNLNF